MREKKPKLKDLEEQLTPISFQWDALAVQLEVADDIIGGERTSNRDNSARLRAILTYWLDNDDCPTWGTIIDILGKPPIRNNRLKGAINDFLAKPSTKQRYS